MQTGIYKHYKGGFYQVLGVARHSETEERISALLCRARSVALRRRKSDAISGQRRSLGCLVWLVGNW